jgi:hypothetical protein
MITESAKTVLDLQRMSLVVCLWCDRSSGGEVGGGGRGIAIFAGVKETGIGTVMDRFEHLWTNKGAACDDALERDHMAKVGGAESPRANVVITEGTIKTNAVSLALNVVLVGIVYLLYDIKKSVVESGKKFYGLLEEAIRIVASIIA